MMNKNLPSNGLTSITSPNYNVNDVESICNLNVEDLCNCLSSFTDNELIDFIKEVLDITPASIDSILDKIDINNSLYNKVEMIIVNNDTSINSQ